MSHFDLTGAHALVTGASAGIGEAVALELAAHGARVSLAARRREKLEELAARIRAKGGTAEIFETDLTKRGAPRKLARDAEKKCGPIDVLINNAGNSGGVERFEEKTAAQVRQTLELNLLAPTELAHEVLGGMIDRDHGTLVSVSSVSAFFPAPATSTYVATKRGLWGLDDVLRVELAGSGVNVMTVFPGPVETDMLRNTLGTETGAQLERMPRGNTAELARLIREGIEKRRSILTYPASYAATRWLTPLLGAAMPQLSGILGLNNK